MRTVVYQKTPWKPGPWERLELPESGHEWMTYISTVRGMSDRDLYAHLETIQNLDMWGRSADEIGTIWKAREHAYEERTKRLQHAPAIDEWERFMGSLRKKIFAT